MRDREALRRTLEGLDARGYRSYKPIAGGYDLGGFELVIDHVQGDPFADPSRMRTIMPAAEAGIPPELLDSEPRRTAVADYLNRAFARALAGCSRDRGSGRSGELTILRPGQEVLRRTSMLVAEDGVVEARFRAGLPARGRSILGREAAEMLCHALPIAVSEGLRAASAGLEGMRRHAAAVEDARALRAQLDQRGLVAFVGDGALLPRLSGVSDEPLAATEAVAFRSPPSLRVTLRAPHAGAVTGMGVPRGVTLLVGGGFHGKSTLLRAIERGVYDHAAGDGRERVVTVTGAVKVRAEDGRRIAGTDISNFISDLPGGQPTRSFRTANASGSTSQAAAIAEALELGAECLLLDEDTSATNFLIRDARVQSLIRRADEPITPFIDRVRTLRDELGVSAILVVGGAGDYFDVADTVVSMREYLPWDATAEARAVAVRLPSRRVPEVAPWSPLTTRIPLPESIDPSRGHRRIDVRAREAERVVFGEGEIRLEAVEQLVEAAQTRAIARALAWGRGRAIDGTRTVRSALEALMEDLAAEGLDAIDDRIVGDYAEFRIFELHAALSRLRSAEFSSDTSVDDNP